MAHSPATHVLQAGAPPSSPTCTTTASFLPSSWILRAASLLALLLRSDQPNRCPTEKLQIQSTLIQQEDRTRALWQATSTARGTAQVVTDSSLAENPYVVTQHHCAVLLNKDTFVHEILCTPIQVPCSLRYSSWTVVGMVVMGKFRRAPDKSCSYFIVANIHFYNKCAKKKGGPSALPCSSWSGTCVSSSVR